MEKAISFVEGAPAAVGPYSIAVSVDKLVFISGQIPLNPVTNELVGESIEEQTIQVLENIKAITAGLGTSMDNVIKTTIFLTDLSSFSIVNEIYGGYFKSTYPARSCVEVSSLPKNSLIEIEAIIESY